MGVSCYNFPHLQDVVEKHLGVSCSFSWSHQIVVARMILQLSISGSTPP